MSSWPTRFDHDEMERLYVEERLSLRRVGALLGCSFERVRQVLKNRGVLRRPMHITRGPKYQGAALSEKRDTQS